MWQYCLWYQGCIVHESDFEFEDEDEAEIEAKRDIQSRIEYEGHEDESEIDYGITVNEEG